MKNRQIAVAVALIGALCSGSYVLGQQTAQTITPQEFADVQNRAEQDGGQTTALFDAYAKIPDNPVVVKQAAQNAWVSSKQNCEASLEVIQIMQNQKLIAQNKRIIELLENKTPK